MPAEEPYSQHEYACRLSWGRRGAIEAAARGDIIVIVDVLSFSTSVVTAAHYGGRIVPCVDEADARESAARLGGTVAGRRDPEPKRGRFSLSPLSYVGMKTGTVVALSSPNGGACAKHASSGSVVLAGGLVNATIAAWAVERARSKTRKRVTIVACGERWEEPGEDGPLRVSLEDYLGAGAILAAISLDKSPEAWVCAGAFKSAKNRVEPVVWECGSSRELREAGHGGDVRHALRVDLYATVPVLRNGVFIAAKDEDDLGTQR